MKSELADDLGLARVALHLREGCVRLKEEERERRALLSFVGQFLSNVLMSGMVCSWSEGFPFFVALCCVHSCERILNALI